MVENRFVKFIRTVDLWRLALLLFILYLFVSCCVTDIGVSCNRTKQVPKEEKGK